MCVCMCGGRDIYMSSYGDIPEKGVRPQGKAKNHTALVTGTEDSLRRFSGTIVLRWLLYISKEANRWNFTGLSVMGLLRELLSGLMEQS